MELLPNTIIHADCLRVLPQLSDESVDFILTDPPYLARYTSRDGRSVPNDDNDTLLSVTKSRTLREGYSTLSSGSTKI